MIYGDDAVASGDENGGSFLQSLEAELLKNDDVEDGSVQDDSESKDYDMDQSEIESKAETLPPGSTIKNGKQLSSAEDAEGDSSDDGRETAQPLSLT